MSAHRWHRPTLKARILAGNEPAWLVNHSRRAYVRQAVLATPPWVDVKALKALAAERDRISKETGVRHVLAHITPLNHPRVCGLNVPENIKIVSWRTNAAESNGWCEWHGELFPTNEVTT
jgi:hypothetical protein